MSMSDSKSSAEREPADNGPCAHCGNEVSWSSKASMWVHEDADQRSCERAELQPPTAEGDAPDFAAALELITAAHGGIKEDAAILAQTAAEGDAEQCRRCGHARRFHHNGRGMCTSSGAVFICSCSRFKRAASPAQQPVEQMNRHCGACLAGQSLEHGEGTHLLRTVEHPEDPSETSQAQPPAAVGGDESDAARAMAIHAVGGDGQSFTEDEWNLIHAIADYAIAPLMKVQACPLCFGKERPCRHHRQAFVLRAALAAAPPTSVAAEMLLARALEYWDSKNRDVEYAERMADWRVEVRTYFSHRAALAAAPEAGGDEPNDEEIDWKATALNWRTRLTEMQAAWECVRLAQRYAPRSVEHYGSFAVAMVEDAKGKWVLVDALLSAPTPQAADRNAVLEEAAQCAEADLLEIPNVLVAADWRCDGGSSERAAIRIADSIRALKSAQTAGRKEGEK